MKGKIIFSKMSQLYYKISQLYYRLAKSSNITGGHFKERKKNSKLLICFGPFSHKCSAIL